MAISTDHEFLTIAEAAELLRVDKSTIRRWIKSERLHPLRIGERTIRIHRSELESEERPGRYWQRMGDDTIHTGPIPPLTEEERERGHRVLEELRQLRREQVEKYGVFETPSWELLHEAREERDRQLMGDA